MEKRECFTRKYFPLLVMLSLAINLVNAQDDLNVIQGKNQWLHYTDSRNALYHHFAREAYEHLEKRSKVVAGLHSLEAWKERQQWIKKTLDEIVGPFPAKTPLNAKTVSTVEKDTYRVEHIIYESQPRFYVTSSLFIPKSLKKREQAPVVIYCSGHATEGYRSDVYQRVILNLVRKGFIVFAFDPVGQGERLQYFEPAKGGSSIGGPTAEHSYPGTQAFITGSSQARYMIWDGIRAVDYLLTRKEVDPSRIGITGRSGGGTQSAYIAAFDERIKAAAPECYITSFTRLLQSIGPQDAEQNFPGGIVKGIDHGDLLIVRAPKPAMMITTTRDIFSIQGARETAGEVSRIYKAYGNETSFGMVEDDAPHASTKKNREAMYAFFQKHLQNPGKPDDEDVMILTEEEIRVTSTGQLSTSLHGETIFTLNRQQAQQEIQKLNTRRKDPAQELTSVVEKAKVLSGYREPNDASKPVFTGRIQREGYGIEKYFVKGEGDYVIPYIMMVPEQPNPKAILYLHPSGKGAEASPNGEMEWFVRKGFAVMAPDLPGIGELGAGDFHGDAFIGGVSHNIWYSSMLIGRSILGVQAGDVNRLTSALDNMGITEIYGIARKELTPLLLHAAAFIPTIKAIALFEPLCSYRSLVLNRFYYSPFIAGAVPASVTTYDLPDLAASLAPRQLIIANSTNGLGELNTAEIDEDFSFVKKVYNARGSGQQLIINSASSPEALEKVFTGWLQ